MPELYNKPALSFQQQLDGLIQRGLSVQDPESALSALSSISYYRLSAYWHPFRTKDDAGNTTDQFFPTADFQEAIKLYEFDRELRLLIIDAIERVEVAVRTQITYHLGCKYGTFGHTEPANFHPLFDHSRWTRKLDADATKSSEEFIRHYRSRYTGFPKLPVWMATEILTFGGLSMLYRGLVNDDKRSVASHFNIHFKRLENWLHTLTYLRNLCAHHSRLWNRELSIRPDRINEPLWQPPITPRNDRLFYILLVLRFLLNQTGNGNDWKNAVIALVAPFADIERYRLAMGIPENWQEHPLWK